MEAASVLLALTLPSNGFAYEKCSKQNSPCCDLCQPKFAEDQCAIPAEGFEKEAGQGGEDITINNHPLCIAPGYPVVVATSTHLTYRDHGMEWELSEKNGFYSPFRYEGP